MIYYFGIPALAGNILNRFLGCARNDPIRVNDTLTGQAGGLENWKEKGKTLKFSVLELIWKISGSRIASKKRF